MDCLFASILKRLLTQLIGFYDEHFEGLWIRSRCICQWIYIFYNKIKLVVIVNGHTSLWLFTERVCCQGVPISPYLSLLCVEIVGIMIRENRLKGS